MDDSGNAITREVKGKRAIGWQPRHQSDDAEAK